jgi:spore photoproduct lyase
MKQPSQRILKNCLKRTRMIKANFKPEKIYIDSHAAGYPLTEKIRQNTKGIPFEVFESVHELLEDVRMFKDPVSFGKKNLFLTVQKGEFIKPCPCTPGYIGCNYFIVNLDLNCPLDCSYCILQHYLNNSFLTIHVNRDDLWTQLDTFLAGQKRDGLRIGTGELGDSLALDHLTESSKDLISYFRNKNNVLFELKTKTINIENILSVEPAENVIISWSLNAEKIAESEEKGAPSISERLGAAQDVARKGFRLGFHFDPLVLHPDWEKGYSTVIKSLLSSVDPDRIAWISLGTLRFTPHLKPIIRKRFPDSQIFYEELIRGKDGKFRYFKPVRFRLYKKIIDCLRREGGGRIPLYFCMESQEIWQGLLQKKPRGKDDVERTISLPLGRIA